MQGTDSRAAVAHLKALFDEFRKNGHPRGAPPSLSGKNIVFGSNVPSEWQSAALASGNLGPTGSTDDRGNSRRSAAGFPRGGTAASSTTSPSILTLPRLAMCPGDLVLYAVVSYLRCIPLIRRVNSTAQSGSRPSSATSRYLTYFKPSLRINRM